MYEQRAWSPTTHRVASDAKGALWRKGTSGLVWPRPPAGNMSTMTNPQAYEAPAVDTLGAVADLTEASGLHNADNPTGVNDAFSNA